MTALQSLHDAQAFEDTRLQQATGLPDIAFPLVARREETENEAWDDFVSMEEYTAISQELVEQSINLQASAVCVAVDTKTILIGMSNSSVLQFDHFGVYRGILSPAQVEQSAIAAAAKLGIGSLNTNANYEGVSVTSVDSFQNSLAVVGYADGSLILFEDGQRMLELIAPNGNAVFSARLITRNLIIAIDCQGSALLIKLSKLFLIGYSCEKVMLLDGQSFGPVFASQQLDTFGLALSCLTQTLVVKLDALEPQLASSATGTATPAAARIAYKWPMPDNNVKSFGLAFHSQAMLRGNRAPAFVLLRCASNILEALDLSTLQSVEVYRRNAAEFISVAFVSNTCAALLDTSFQLEIVDLKTGQVVGKRNLTSVQFVPFTFPSHPGFESFDNSIDNNSSNNACQLYCLGATEMVKVGISPWTTRVDRFVQSGQWMEALTLALRCKKTSNAAADEERLGELLTQYLLSNTLNADIGLVCIEYSLAIRRPELIFSICLDAFSQVGKTRELLELVFVLVLRGKMECDLPPHFYALLLEHVLLEHCEQLELFLLSLYELPVFDLDGCIRLCKERKMFSALAKFYTKVLNDFVMPCEMAVTWIVNADLETKSNFGYRFLLYLSYSLLGVEFPSGAIPLPPTASNVKSTLVDYFFRSESMALKICLEFDAVCFLKLFQDAIFNSPFVDHCLTRLLEVRGDLPCVLQFAANCMCAIKQPNTRRAQVFAYMHQQLPTTDLLIEFIHKYPEDLIWYQEQAALQCGKRLEVDILLKQMELKTSNGNKLVVAEQLFALLLEARNAEWICSFVKEYHTTESFLRLYAAHSHDLVQFDNNSELISVLFEIDPHLLMDHLSDEDKFRMLNPLIALGGKEVTLEMANTFVDLLCKHDPTQAYAWLSKNEGRYNVDFALQACHTYAIRNAEAYLLERLGKVAEALELVLQDEDLEASLPVAINLCTSFGEQTEWFKVLDACLGNSKLVEQVLEAMIPTNCVDARVILTRLKSPQDMRVVLAWFKREQSIWSLARRVLRDDLNLIEHQSRAHKAKAVKCNPSEMVQQQQQEQNVNKKQGKSRPMQSALVVAGFEDFDALELCWNAKHAVDLSQALLLGTDCALRLSPVRSLEEMLACEELVDAGL